MIFSLPAILELGLLINRYDRNCLDSLSKKDPIACSSMKKSDKWCDTENVVSSLLVGSPSIHDTTCLLDESIY